MGCSVKGKNLKLGIYLDPSVFPDVCVCLKHSFSLKEQESENDENRSAVIRGMRFGVGSHRGRLPVLTFRTASGPVTEGFPARGAALSPPLHSVPNLGKFPPLLPRSLSPSPSASLPLSL